MRQNKSEYARNLFAFMVPSTAFAFYVGALSMPVNIQMIGDV